jgi:hypothetical protein
MGSCDRIEQGKKDTVIIKSKDFDDTAAKGKIIDLTAQIKLQDNEGEKTTQEKEISKIAEEFLL